MALVAVLGPLVNGYDPIRDSISELGAVDAPARQLVNIGGFMGVGATILAFAGGSRSGAGWLRWGAAGGFMITVGFLPCDLGAPGPLIAIDAVAAATGLLQRFGMGLSLLWVSVVEVRCAC